MRTLLLHTGDSPERGPWLRERWDRVVDLGMAGPDTYARWSEIFGCPVTNSGFASLPPGPIREALGAGVGLLRDEHGIDWWDVLCAAYIQPLYEALALQAIAEANTHQEFFASRNCFHARALEVLTKRRVQVFARNTGAVAKAGRFHQKLRRLSWKQVRQIMMDKYDSKHKVRAAFAARPPANGSPVVLLPTAYVNVSRTALAYAQELPDRQFLLVAARRSGWCRDLPPNVVQADMAAYSRPRRQKPRAQEELISRLPRLHARLKQGPLWSVVAELHVLDDLEENLRRWLVVRDAWLNVFDCEHVTSVLSCDSANPYTLIPVMIAKKRGIPAVLAHHGALDGHYLVKSCHADFILTKGEMERDYLVRRCGIPCEQVVVGAPAAALQQARTEQSHIVFFSEDYEVSGARVNEFYRSVLPGLAKLAIEHGKELILKLHPAENLRDRQRTLGSVLPPDKRQAIEIVEGPLHEDLMTRAWFGVAGISTTAVQCAMRGVPVFLCEWLENWPYGYLDQFAKFGVGARLKNPAEIRQIPTLLRQFETCNTRQLWNPINSDLLHQLLIGGGITEMAAAI